MKPKDLLLRCYARKSKEGYWEAICLDLCLAAQGDTFQEARTSLHEQIIDYLNDALIGEDREFADQLLPRKAPLEYWLQYYCVKIINWALKPLRAVITNVERRERKTPVYVRAKLFRETLPLRPAHSM